MRVANQIIRKPVRALPKTRGAGSDKAIATTDPNTLNTNVPKITDAHGVSGGSSCQVTLAVFGAADITVWVWFAACAKWVKLGSNATQNTKTFDANTVDGFSIPENTAFYLQASAEVTDAYTDCKAQNAL